MASFQDKIGWKGRERDKIKINVPSRSYPTRNGKFQKNCEKIVEIRKYHYRFLSSQNRLEEAEKERKYKNYRSVPFCSYPAG